MLQRGEGGRGGGAKGSRGESVHVVAAARLLTLSLSLLFSSLLSYALCLSFFAFRFLSVIISLACLAVSPALLVALSLSHFLGSYREARPDREPISACLTRHDGLPKAGQLEDSVTLLSCGWRRGRAREVSVQQPTIESSVSQPLLKAQNNFEAKEPGISNQKVATLNLKPF